MERRSKTASFHTGKSVEINAGLNSALPWPKLRPTIEGVIQGPLSLRSQVSLRDYTQPFFISRVKFYEDQC